MGSRETGLQAGHIPHRLVHLDREGEAGMLLQGLHQVQRSLRLGTRTMLVFSSLLCRQMEKCLLLAQEMRTSSFGVSGKQKKRRKKQKQRKKCLQAGVFCPFGEK